MNDRILQRYAATSSHVEALNGPPMNDNEGEEDLVAFGWLRGMRERAVMLELRKKDGSMTGFDYALLRKLVHDPSEGITLHFGGEEVKIRGRNLGRDASPGIQLLRGILWHRVPWIQEASDADILKAEEGATVVESIRW